MGQKPRKFVMVQVTEEEKNSFKHTANDMGFNAVSVWFKWVAKRAQRAHHKKDVPNA